MHHQLRGHNRHVAPFAPDDRLTEFHRLKVVRHFVAEVV
jgi:hypothetical protein